MSGGHKEKTHFHSSRGFSFEAAKISTRDHSPSTVSDSHAFVSKKTIANM